MKRVKVYGIKVLPQPCYAGDQIKEFASASGCRFRFKGYSTCVQVHFLEQFKKAVKAVKTLISVENNATGQLGLLLN